MGTRGSMVRPERKGEEILERETERESERRMRAGGPMAIITRPLDGEIQMQVIGPRIVSQWRQAPVPCFPFGVSSLRSYIAPFDRYMRKAILFVRFQALNARDCSIIRRIIFCSCLSSLIETIVPG